MINETRDRSGFRPAGLLLAVFAASAAGGFGPGGRPATLTAAPHATLPLKGRPIEVALQPLRFDALDSQDTGGGGFVSRGNGYALLLERGGAVVSLSGRPQSSSSLKTPGAAAAVVRMTWPGANRRVRPAGLEPAPGVSNYLIGNDPARWRLGVPSFGRVQYRDLYPGIDLAFYGNQERLEYDFVVAPGGDPRAIRLRFSGEDAIRIDAHGDLVVRAGSAEIVQQAPVVYQEHEGTRQRVAGRYVKTNRHEVGFVVAPYDRTRTLYIDPVLAFSSFLGTSGSDRATAVAVDSAGFAYVTGSTLSFNPSEDVFVIKISPTGALVYATYVLSHNTQDRGRGIAVDSAGNAYVTGDTSYPGSGPGFPIVGGFVPTASPTVSGGAILFKLNSAGDNFLYSTVLTSGSASVGYGVAVEGANAYVVGQAVAGPNFPIWPDTVAHSGFIGSAGVGENYAFIVKIDTSSTGLSSLAYATRFGGSDTNLAHATAVNAAGQAYVTGSTTSSDFPLAGSPADGVCGTGSNCNGRVEDAFVSKFSAAGTALVYSTYAGGSRADVGNAIAIDGAGSAYVSGSTLSPEFPVTPGAFDPGCSTVPGCSFSDGFVLKLSPTGSSFAYSTYLGGQSEDAATAIAVDPAGNAHVAGYSGSADFPVTGDAFQRARAGANFDAFVSVLNTAGSGLVYSSYLGGTGNISGGDKAFGIALDSAGSAWIVGQTDSPDFPVTSGAIQPAHGGGLFDGFAVKISSPPAAPSRDDLVVDFGPTNGLWLRNGDTAGWTQLHTLSAKNIVTGDLDGNGTDEVIVDFGPQGIWIYYNRSNWVLRHLSTANRMAVGDLDGNGKAELLVDFQGFGIWAWTNNASWSLLHSSNSINIVTGDLDGNGKKEVIIDFLGFGIWVWQNNTSWLQLHALNSRLTTVGDFDGNGRDDVIVDFAGYGIWNYANNSSWSQIHSRDPSHLAAGDVDGNGQSDLIVDFGSQLGIWMLMNSATWSQIHTLTSTNVLCADQDSNGKADVIVNFGAAGLWEYANNTSWIPLHALSPGLMVAGHINAP